MNKLPFKISASLKNIIGKDLITDDYIAVFELVKNSYDAHATHVQIIFGNDKVIIRDDGKGMDYDDIINRWLFVAYSAKKEGVEDNELDKEEFKDYRDKISRNKFFAGAKGIGRFSCDKLGKNLRLITKKITKDSNIEEIKVNWEDFEQDTNKEFVNISVEHNTLDHIIYDNFRHGTILEITGLNSNWNREKKRNLKHSLEKLINPIESENSEYSFSVEIIDPNEKEDDKNEKLDRKKVNGFVKNFVFETLKLKTTHISTKITSNKIITELNDRGKKLYEIEEENTFDEIDDLTIKLFYLNRKAKYNFTQKMGIRNRHFGSIFLYKNGIRIYPYGDPNEDFFGIDRRKGQGWARNLGTRDLLGRLELFDSGDKFKETTSRDGGLVENKSFNQLVTVFKEKCFYRLEQYVVGVQWSEDIDDSDKDTEDTSKLDNITAKTKIINIISKLANSKDIKRIIHYDKDFLNIINEKTENLSPNIFKELENIAEKDEDVKFKDRIQIAKQQYDKIVKEKEESEKKRKEAERKKEEAERKAKEHEEARKRAEKEKEQRVNQVRFLQSVKAVEYEDVRNLNHIIGLKSDLINKQIRTIKKKIDKGKNLSKEEIFKFLKSISLANSQITSITRFTTKGNFLQASQDTTENIVKFIINYIENIYTQLFPIKTKYINKDIEFNYHFVPIDFTMILDNLISNSRKAKADTIEIEFVESSENELTIYYRDNGNNLDESINNPNIIFEEGFTTTNGSGLGLSHVKKVIDDLNGDIKFNPNEKDKFELIIKLYK